MDYTVDNSVVSVKDWFLTLLVASLPLIGIIMLFVWAFGSGTNINKSNLAKAALLWYAVLIGLWILFIFVFGGLAAISNMAN